MSGARGHILGHRGKREAERVVALYPKYRDRVSFVVVDVTAPTEAQIPLVKAHYHGWIPTLAVLAADGSVVYADSGETADERGDTREPARIIDKALADEALAR